MVEEMIPTHFTCTNVINKIGTYGNKTYFDSSYQGMSYKFPKNTRTCVFAEANLDIIKFN